MEFTFVLQIILSYNQGLKMRAVTLEKWRKATHNWTKRIVRVKFDRTKLYNIVTNQVQGRIDHKTRDLLPVLPESLLRNGPTWEGDGAPSSSSSVLGSDYHNPIILDSSPASPSHGIGLFTPTEIPMCLSSTFMVGY